jgi:hypothetical protein
VRRCRSRICGSPAATPLWRSRSWLARGSPETSSAARAAIAEVEAFCTDTGYPQTRFDAATLAAAELLRRVSHGDIAEMGALLAQAVPPVAPSGTLVPGPELPGRVVTYRWSTGGQPDQLLGPSSPRPEPESDTHPGTCQRCGKPLHTEGSRGGRPAKYCSGACRTAAHRALHRTAPATADRSRGLSTPNRTSTRLVELPATRRGEARRLEADGICTENGRPARG